MTCERPLAVTWWGDVAAKPVINSVGVGLDELETRSRRCDDERAEGGLERGSAGDEHRQERRGSIGQERTYSSASLMIGQMIFGR